MDKIADQEGRKFDQIMIKASPFVRTMATAARIGKELSITKVALDWCFCEILATFLYKSNPLPNMEVRKKSAEDLDKEYELQGITFNDPNPD